MSSNGNGPEEAPKQAPKQNTGLSALDLASLGDLSFGTAWSEVRQAGRSERGPRSYDGRPPRREGGERPRREDRFRAERPADERGPRKPRAEGDRPQGERPPRREGGERPQGERSGHPRGPRTEGETPRREYRQPHREPLPEKPFEPVVAISIFPEDVPFERLVGVLRQSHRTFELFEIAAVILEKPKRFIINIEPFKDAAAKGAPTEFFVSVGDGVPFESRDEALAHILATHGDQLVDVETVETEAPKGAFTVVHKCGITGELLAPPNYHKYAQIVRQHLAEKLPGMTEEQFKRRIESVKDEETIKQWIAKMSKQTRLVWKGVVAEGAERPVFESRDALKAWLSANLPATLVQTVKSLRIKGSQVEQVPAGSRIRKSLDSYLAQQRKFPLDTANHLRGRLRRDHFTIYKVKKDNKSYICAVKRTFRTQGQTFGENFQHLIEFIEQHPYMKADMLASEFLGLAKPEEGKDYADTDKPKINALRNDLGWLVREGYIVEYGDGRLFANPVLQAGAKAPADEEESAAPEAPKA